MYKISYGGKTRVGCNEDAWRLTPHLWFETRKEANQFGAAFTGSRFDGANGYAPQSGMNEQGLAFSRLAAKAPEHVDVNWSSRKPITNHTMYLKNILHTCANVQEVKSFISGYNHSCFTEDVFIYIDKSGDYLIVEPYGMSIGKDSTYVLSNFCPSVTDETKACKLDRYRHGVEFLKQGLDSSLDYCIAMSDTMKVCRDKLGDGTLLTSIWNLQEGTFNLFFYHRFDGTLKFDLNAELQKGDHSIALSTLFPPNPEFQKLSRFQIPQNNDKLRLLLVCLAGFLFVSSLYFLTQLLKGNMKNCLVIGWIILLNILLIYYLFLLNTTIGMFYFPSPYYDANNFLSISFSYVPFVLLLSIFPLVAYNLKVLKVPSAYFVQIFFLSCNHLVYFMLLLLFLYWGLFGFMIF